MFIGQTFVKLGGTAGAEISKPSILVDFWHFLGKKLNVTYMNYSQQFLKKVVFFCDVGQRWYEKYNFVHITLIFVLF